MIVLGECVSIGYVEISDGVCDEDAPLIKIVPSTSTVLDKRYNYVYKTTSEIKMRTPL